MKHWRRYTVLFLLVLIVWFVHHIRFQPERPIWDEQVYIWQRVWNPQHAAALYNSRDLFSTLRVLGLQVLPHEGARDISVDTALLRKDGRPLWLVVRLDGQLSQLDQDMIFDHLLRTLQRWREAGLPVAGVEIDHDASTARLPDYQHFLQQLRQQLPKKLQLSITALPAWISSPYLPGILQQVSSSVLQVHAVNSPERGLFNGSKALRWVRQYARISNHPFRVALPAYGMGLLGTGAQGPEVESETSLRIAGNIHELSVTPAQVADFMLQLSKHLPKHLQGLIWFRLPLAGDRRAWSMKTLRAVIKHQPLITSWHVLFLPRSDGLYDLRLQNNGTVDALLPLEIHIKAKDCQSADAVGNYRLEASETQQHFIRTNEAQVRVGQSRPLGWLRCKSITPGGTDVVL